MYRRGGDEYVNSRRGGVLYSVPRGVNVAVDTPREGADRRVLYRPGNFRDRIEIPLRRDRETSLDNVHAHSLERLRDLELLLGVHRASGSLFAVPQRRVEYLYIPWHASILFISEPLPRSTATTPVRHISIIPYGATKSMNASSFVG